MFSGKFSLIIEPAEATKKNVYEDAYGPDVLEVKATYRGSVVYRAFTPASNPHATAGHIVTAISVARELAPGIDTAHVTPDDDQDEPASDPAI